MAYVQNEVARCQQKHRGEQKCGGALACKSINVKHDGHSETFMTHDLPTSCPPDLAWIKLVDEEGLVEGDLSGQWHLNTSHHWP